MKALTQRKGTNYSLLNNGRNMMVLVFQVQQVRSVNPTSKGPRSNPIIII